MPTPVYTYKRPGTTVISSPPQTFQPASVLGNTILVLARFAKGPRYPTLTDASGAAAQFGNPSAASGTGFDGALMLSKMALQRNPTAFQPPTYLICRVGVAPASVAVMDGSAGTCFTLTGEGAYAGTAGANLAYSITVVSGAVTNIAFYDTSSGTPVLLQQFIAGRNDLSSNQSIVREINGQNPLYSLTGALNPGIVQAAIGTSVNLPVAVTTPAAFSAGSPNDGANATATDATIAGLLNESLKFNVQYITAAFDAATVAPAIQAHQTAALVALQWRFAALGPQLYTTYSSLATTYVASIASQQVAVMKHDAYLTANPVTNSPLVVPGYIFAGAWLALKASGPTQETTTRQVVVGFSNILTAPGKTGALSSTEQDALAVDSGGFGGIVGTPTPDGILINHALTTAAYNFNGGINAFSEVNAVNVDNAYNRMLVDAAAPLIGRVYKKLADQQAAILRQVNNSAAPLDSAGTINGYTHQLSRDPQTGNTLVGATYGLPVGTNYIQYQSGGIQVQG